MKRLNGFIEKKFLRAVAEEVRLSALWSRLAPSLLVAHVRPVSYRNGCLTLSADSPSWASRARLQQPLIIQALRTDAYFCDLTTLQVRIAPKGAWDIGAGAGQPANTTHFSRRTANLLAQLAEQASDPELAAAFGRLAKTAARRVSPSVSRYKPGGKR